MLDFSLFELDLDDSEHVSSRSEHVSSLSELLSYLVLREACVMSLSSRPHGQGMINGNPQVHRVVDGFPWIWVLGIGREAWVPFSA